jgi:hypothetical protein
MMSLTKCQEHHLHHKYQWLAATSFPMDIHICICWLAQNFGAIHYRKIFEQFFCLVWAFCWETENISHHSLLMQVTHKVETSNPLQQLSSIPKGFFFLRGLTKDCSMEHKMKTVSNSLHHVCNLVFHKHPRISSNWHWWHWYIWWGWTSYLEGFWFLLEDFLKIIFFAWWNIWVSIILLLS